MPDLGAVDLNLLVALDHLLEERSVRGAARRAHVSPSAMSHTLGRLRELLGDELLVRAGGEMVATPKAEALAVPLKDLLAGVRELLADPGRFDPSTLRRAFRVVCTDHVSTVLLVRAEAILRREAPGVAIYVLPVTPETMGELRRGVAEVAVGVFPDASPEIRQRRLFGDGFVTVCRPGHPRAGDAELSLDAFLAEDHVLVAPRGTPEGHVDRVLAARGLARRIYRTFPNFLAALLHVTEHDALLTVSRRLVDATRERFLKGLDDIGITLVHEAAISAFEASRPAWMPRTDTAAS